MAGHKNHDYHILPPSPWPLAASLAAFVLAFGGVTAMHPKDFGPLGGPWLFALGAAAVIASAFMWWRDVVVEANRGDHTPVVQLHLRYGMMLFILSEVMFFLGWFWAWFDFTLFPSAAEVIGGIWPPKGFTVINPFALPLLNTFILLTSGTTVTWAHHALITNNRRDLIRALWLTVLLGLLFSAIQFYEYSEAPFAFTGNSYGSAFMMATGFHGVHVIVGTIFLIVNLVRAYRGAFTPRQHFGFEAAAWYWHFVDVVWLFLFLVVYVWGSAGAPVHG